MLQIMLSQSHLNYTAAVCSEICLCFFQQPLQGLYLVTLLLQQADTRFCNARLSADTCTHASQARAYDLQVSPLDTLTKSSHLLFALGNCGGNRLRHCKRPTNPNPFTELAQRVIMKQEVLQNPHLQSGSR